MTTLKQLALPALALLACSAGFAQEVGRVISTQPVIQQVSVPRRVCRDEQVLVQQPKTGAGAAIGAVVGGALGAATGHGPAGAAAAAVGAITGAVVGNNIESTPPAQAQTVQACSVQNFVENRTVGYNVTYEYAGKRYTVQMPQPPGATIALQVTPTGATAATTTTETVVQADPVIEESPTVYSPVYVRPYYAPPPVIFEGGYWCCGRHWYRH